MNEEIQELLSSHERGLNEGDPMLIRSVYADDAMFIGQPFPTATGIDDAMSRPRPPGARVRHISA